MKFISATIIYLFVFNTLFSFNESQRNTIDTINDQFRDIELISFQVSSSHETQRSPRVFNLLGLFNSPGLSNSSEVFNSAGTTDKSRVPMFDASIKTKYEYALKTKMSRFSVRNSRMGISGYIADPLKYRVQVELSSEGKFEVLDLNGTINLFKGFNLTLGQIGLPIFNSYIITPSQMLFANRAFIGKYFIGTRDIGVLASYRSRLKSIPVEIELGVFNGTTINNPEWTNRPSYAGRVQFGNMTGLRATAKFYKNAHINSDDLLFLGADIRYSSRNYKIEAEFMNRHNVITKTDRSAIYIQGAYTITSLDGKMVRSLTPAVRWDAIGENLRINKIDASRFTFGLALGLSGNPNGSLIRFDYEHYLVERPIAEFNKYYEMDSDKFTVELLVIF
jgi:hypothetical protein